MGISSDGQICFGIAFEEEYEFPWQNEKWDGYEEEWWLYGVCGYKPPFEIYDESGEYIDGKEPTKEKKDAYYSHYRDFEEKHPMPVEIVRHCSYDYSMYIVAVKGTYIENSRGYPVKFDPQNLSITDEQKKVVVDFCEKYCQPVDEYTDAPEFEPYWYLTSMYG
jgi:hypothetical protein